MIKLEIIDYDLEGAAYRDGDGDGPIVAAHALILKAKTRGLIVAQNIPLRVPCADMIESDRAELFAAFGTIERVALRHAYAEHARKAAQPEALHATIADAYLAERELAANAALIKEQEAKIAALDARLAALAEVTAP